MLSKFSIKRPVTTIMILLIVILTGLVSILGLSMDLMPSIDLPIAIVSTTYVGAGPEEMETLITEPIEEALGTVSNVDEISSTSSANSSIVIVQFVDGTDLDMAAVDMRERVDMIKSTLPDGAEEPVIMKIDISSLSSIIVGVSSDMDLKELSTLLDEEIVNRFERIEGVASANLSGNVEDEIQIVVNPERMQGYGLTTSQIASVLASENANYPTGQILQGTTDLQLRAVGEFQSIDEIRNLQLTTPTGAVIRLSDVAEVNQVEKEETSYTLVNGERSIVLIIQKESDANIVDISDEINAEIADIERAYPQLHFSMLSDTASYIRTSVYNVLETAIQSAILAVIVLFIFLRDYKTSLIIGVSIPTSIVATFALMYVSDMTLNIISLGGLTIGVGMLVDNSVVVLECIYRHFQEGESPEEAARVGAAEVAMSVMASTLTTVAVFIPLVFVSGLVGQMFKDLSLTISFSLLASLVVSLTFVPMACAYLLKREEKKKKKTGPVAVFLEKWGNAIDALDTNYRKILTAALKHKKRTVAVVLVAFVATLSLVPIMGLELLPEMDEGSASISISMPQGTVLDETVKVVDQVMERIDGIPETEESYVIVGDMTGLSGSSTDSATITMNFVSREDRDRSTDEIVQELKQRIADVPGADITVSASSMAMGSYGSSNVSVQINGDDNEELRRIGLELVDVIGEVDGIVDPTSSVEEAVPEANIIINREKAAQYGVNATSLATTISTAVTGSVATEYKVNGTELDVRIKQSEESIEYLNDLENMTITTQTGAVIPITEVADIVIQDSSTAITRMNSHNYITVSGDVRGRDISSVQRDVAAKLDSYPFPEGFTYEFTGTVESMEESFRSLGIVLIVAILLVYMIMAAQFESLLHPFIVMFSVPLALTGAILGLFITGNSISMTAFMGFIMLVGMVVNNAIVLVDYTNQLRDRGMGLEEALIKAGPTRLRPILMTTLTTILGLVPMAVRVAEGTEMQQPLAISVIFGLTISTVVTLIFVPVVYSSFESAKIRRKEKKQRKREMKNHSAGAAE